MTVYSRRAVDETATRATFAEFLRAPSADAAEEALGRLLERHLAPLVRSIVETRLRREQVVRHGADAGDVAAGVLLRLTERLWAQRLAPGADGIADLEGYAASSAHNACHAFLRRRYPERARLRARLRYLLTHDPALASWLDAGGEALCGTAASRGGRLVASSAAWLADARTRARAEPGAAGFLALVRELLRGCPGPCRLEDLVDALAFVLGVQDGPSSDDTALETVAARTPTPAEAAQQRQWLGRVWREVRELPRPQRVALLLNLRDPGGRSVLGLLPLTGTASREEIAAALDVPQAVLADAWDAPRDDAWIASFLAVTARQVINLRKSARERLARRMRRAGTAVTSPAARALNLGSAATPADTESKP